MFLGIIPVQGPGGWHFLMSEIPPAHRTTIAVNFKLKLNSSDEPVVVHDDLLSSFPQRMRVYLTHTIDLMRWGSGIWSVGFWVLDFGFDVTGQGVKETHSGCRFGVRKIGVGRQ